MISNEAMKNIKGGALTATMINAVMRGASILLLAGQYAGSAVRRFSKKNYC